MAVSRQVLNLRRRRDHDPGTRGLAVEEAGELVGYCCFGFEARVPGVEEEPGTLDVGYGMRPDLMGQGSGRTFVAAILDFAENEFPSQRLRLLILQWNERSRNVADALGFEEAGVVQSDEGGFWVVTRAVSAGISSTGLGVDRAGHGAEAGAVDTLLSRKMFGVIGWTVLVILALGFAVPLVLFALAGWGMGWTGLRLGEHMRESGESLAVGAQRSVECQGVSWTD